MNARKVHSDSRQGSNVIREALLATGLLLATFTQLRPSAVALGPGELCLAVWLCLTLPRCIGSLLVPMPPVRFRLLLFWLILSAALCIGTMTAVIVGERNVKEYFLHDVLAYVFVASITLLAVLQADAARRLRRAAWFLVLLGSWLVAMQLAEAHGQLSIGGADVWYYDRFIGWCSNANQMGLLCLILALLSLHLAETSSRLFPRFVAVLSGILPVWAGFLTRSDAFMLALAFSVCCAVALKWRRLLIAPRRRLSLATLSVLLATFTLPALVAATTPLAFQLASRVFAQDAPGETAEKLERDVGGRAKLWAQALERGIESRLLGLGPGPHLIRPAELREPRMGWLPDFEAHNTFVDMFLQGGLLALAGLLWLLATAVRTALNANLCCLPALVVGTAGFALTHFIIRHPIVWLVVALAFAVGTSYGQRAMKADDWHRARLGA